MSPERNNANARYASIISQRGEKLSREVINKAAQLAAASDSCTKKFATGGDALVLVRLKSEASRQMKNAYPAETRPEEINVLSASEALSAPRYVRMPQNGIFIVKYM